MNDSILDSVKKVCNIPIDDDSFDTDILMHINTSFMILEQLGVDKNIIKVEDNTTTWDDILQGYDVDLEAVKTYIAYKVRMIFDPPTASTIKDAYSNAISELEWTINAQVDKGE